MHHHLDLNVRITLMLFEGVFWVKTLQECSRAGEKNVAKQQSITVREAVRQSDTGKEEEEQPNVLVIRSC